MFPIVRIVELTAGTRACRKELGYMRIVEDAHSFNCADRIGQSAAFGSYGESTSRARGMRTK
jgi:hypothetical protein